MFNFFTSNRSCFKLVTSSGVVYIAITLLCCSDLCHKWTEDTIVIVSIIVPVALFSIQKFGTTKMGFLFSPILTLWFIALGSIGIYNIVMNDIYVLRAINPAYIYYFIKKNGKRAWSALGGCVLCGTDESVGLLSLFISIFGWQCY